LDNFRLCSRISPEWINISQVGRVFYQRQPLPRRAKKLCELWSTNEKAIGAHIDLPMRIFLGKPHFGPWGCCPLKFLHALQIDQALLAHTKTGTAVPPKKHLIVKIYLSPERIDISQIGRVFLSTTTHSTLGEKFGELWSTNKNVLLLILTHPSGHFSADYILTLGGVVP